MTAFRILLEEQFKAGKMVCVGLDTDFARLPEVVRKSSDPQFEFNRRIIDATADVVCAYKPNSAFYESQGSTGIESLIRTVAYVREVAPDVPVILDAKRGDIGTTNTGYVDFIFGIVNAHAVTVHPFLGSEAASAFLEDSERGVLVLCRTSNPGGGQFQDLTTRYGGEEMPLYQVVALTVRDEWNQQENCGLVVGATYPSELKAIRELVPNLPLLIPGIGAQGGDAQKTMQATATGSGPLIINSSRAIIFASSETDFDQEARRATQTLDHELRDERALAIG